MNPMDPITATLVPEAGPGDVMLANEVFPLRGKFVNIGRGVQNQIVLESLQISRRHAELKYDNGKWSIRDVSTNGIALNSRRLPQQQFLPLQHQDLIQFIPTPAGQLVYKFMYNNSEEVVVDEDDDAESLLSVKSPSEPIVIDDKKPHKRKLNWNASPPSQKRRQDPELIDLSDEDDEKTPSENDKPLSSFTEAELQEEVKLLKGRLARSKEQHRKQIDNLQGEKRRLEVELENTREQAEEFGGRINGLLESELNCCVCNEVFVDARVTSCGHTFCAYCIRVWLRKKGDCPMCRKQIRGSNRHVEIDNFLDKTFSLLPADAQARRQSLLAERKVQEQQFAASNAMPQAQAVAFVGQLHAFNQLIMSSNPPMGVGRRSSRRSRRDRHPLPVPGHPGGPGPSAQVVQMGQPGVIDLSVNQ